MKKLNNKGLSVVELIVSFVLCLLVFIFIIQVVSSVEELYLNLGVKTELLNKQALISEKINKEFLNNETVLIKNCGDDCLVFFSKNQTYKKMQIDKAKNTFIVDGDVFDFSGLGFVDSLTANVTSDYAYSYSILTIDLGIKNSIFDSGKYLIKAYLQFNSDEIVYSPSNSNKAEIFLLGPATSYKFSEDLFIEPGWIVYYPSGKITINGTDVRTSNLDYDSDGNGFIKYTGVGEAAGSEKIRTIKSYKLAKDYIIDTYTNIPSSGIYLYSELGKYVYKGADPNNYLAIGSKLFRIISLDIQQQYVIGEDGRVVTIDGVKQKENKYLLKVVSEDFIENEEHETILPFGTASGGPLFYNSLWEKTTCSDDICNTERQYINSLVNDVYLQGLLNTGSGQLQIKNGTFNVGVVDWTSYVFSLYGIQGIPDARVTYQAKEIYEVEGADHTWPNKKVDPGKWNGDCVDDVCSPNAAILSLTDILFSSGDNECLGTIVIQNGVKCSNDNWLWKQNSSAEDSQYYRLMTRNTINNTWILSEMNQLFNNSIYMEYKTRATLYLDADLYIMGSGTKDSPYVLYTMKKEHG